MAKFWGSVAVLIVIGLVALSYGARSSGINFKDLETECRYGTAQDAQINLRDGRLVFRGNFPVDNPDSDLSYSYRKRSGRITLNVRASDESPPSNFTDDCLGAVHYSARTDAVPEGDYVVTLKHDGSVYDKRVVSVQ